MSSATHRAMSECSYPESENEDLKFQILKVCQHLTAVMKEEADLRRDLEELLDRQEAEALKELKKGEENIAMIRVEREQIRRRFWRGNEHTRAPSATLNGPHDSYSVPVSPSPSSLPVENNDPMHLDQSHKSSGTTTSQNLDTPASAANNESQTKIAKLEPEEPKAKFGINKLVLELDAEFREEERRFEQYRSMVEEAKEKIRYLEKVERICAEKRLNDSRVFAQKKKNAASHTVSTYQSSVTHYRNRMEVIRPILMQLREEEMGIHA